MLSTRDDPCAVQETDVPSIDIALNISAEQCRAHYAGAADSIRTRTLDGRSVVLPSRVLHHIIGRDGVRGTYRVTFDDNGRFVSIRAL
ncbi:uncharacterized protein DUF2835 [Kushneria indalinina DSM 14324]|uniref:Uncharacterized protein DUF2835 n=1 Tax=Kushneria indalinina DSM 14324 TaxID=1122140 RepID=A0A3D9DVL1_9GAMM|nr:uncharacterized protein DUF2835 [Kushneria indalinina DSM 14324]